MEDSCNSDTLTTNECTRNSYTSKRQTAQNPNGIRIDHIFIRSAPHIEASIVEHILPFPDRVPGQSYSYSDHEAVLSKLRLIKTANPSSSPEQSCSLSALKIHSKSNSPSHNAHNNYEGNYCVTPSKSMQELHAARLSVLHEAIALCDTALEQLKMDRWFYYGIAALLTFVLIALVEFTIVPAGFKMLYWMLKFMLFTVILYCLFMGSIWNFMERNGILSGKMDMSILLKSAEKYELDLNLLSS